MTEIEKKVIKAFALDNAIKHDGKANQGAVMAGLFSVGLEKSEIKDYMPKISEVMKEVNAMDLDAQEKEFEKLQNLVSHREIREGLPELENVKKHVNMRIAPFPSGALHIGNARQVILNDEYVKKYGGKYMLVMDDTIGSEKKQIDPEAYKLIEEGIKWLGCDVDKKIIYKSDRNEIYYKHAEELLKKGYMYVCNCNADQWREDKIKGMECACRQIHPDEQMKRWHNLFKEELAFEGEWAVRLKTNMQDPDPAFRDRVMFKISDRKHPKTGNKYRVYPSMDFSWGIDDHLFGMTHIIRGADLQIATRVQDFIRDVFSWEHPVSRYTGLLILEGIKMSKSKGAAEVKSGEYTGWNDPRLWSLQSLRDRGIKPESIREFITSQGMSKSNTTVPIDVLYSINKKNLENVSRYFFVEKPIKIKIAGCPELEAKLPLHPSQDKGFRNYKTNQEFIISENDLTEEPANYRLMHLLNFKMLKLHAMKNFEFSYISVDPDPELKAKFIQWLPANEDNVKIKIRMDDNSIIEGLGEPELAKLKEGEIIQFERFGFVKLYKKSKDEMEFWFAHK